MNATAVARRWHRAFNGVSERLPRVHWPRVVSLLAGCMLATLSALAGATATLRLNYQGYLTSSNGTPLDQQVQMTFRIFDAASDGVEAWTETQTVTVTNGLFDVMLGTVTPLGITFNKNYWLEVQVGAETLAPRRPIGGSPYSGFAIAPACNAGDFIGCYTGPPATAGVGACKAGTRSCDPTTNLYGACTGQVLPAAETYDGVDNDCDGTIDNGVVPDGGSCTINGQCISSHCNAGTCGPAPLPNGSACTANNQCASGFCVAFVCSPSP